MQQFLQQFDVGATIAVGLVQSGGTGFDLDGTEQAWLLLETPSGRQKRLDATVDSSAETVERVTQPLDLDEFGTYRVQALVERTGLSARSAVLLLEVRSNLDTPAILLLPGLAEGLAVGLGPWVTPFAELQQAASGGSDTMQDELLSVDADYSGGDWASTDADASWLNLPVARLPYPRLAQAALVQWDVTCLYYKTGGGAQVLRWELVDNGVATGAFVDFSDSTSVNLPSKVLLTMDLRVVHDPQGTPLYDLEFRERRRAQSGATIADQTAARKVTLDPRVDHDLRLRVRKTGIVGDGLLVRSHSVRQPVRRKGS